MAERQLIMQFPKFSNQFRCHMPFCNECNGKMVYMICTSEKNGLWKVCYYQNNQWKRLTNSDDNVIQCNPNVYYMNNKYYVSYVEFTKNEKYLLKCLSGQSLDKLTVYKQIVTFTGFQLDGKIYKTNRPNGFEIVTNDETKLVTLDKCNKILRLTYNPINKEELIVTYLYQDKSFVCLVNNDVIKQIVANEPLYKTFKYGEDYWNVFKFHNTDNLQLRIINKLNCNLVDTDNKVSIKVKK